LVHTPTPCFAKNRLDVTENKELGTKNSQKRGWILLKELGASLQRRSRNCISESGGVVREAEGGQDLGGTELRNDRDGGVAAKVMKHFTS
jgi:hypothetical protein